MEGQPSAPLNGRRMRRGMHEYHKRQLHYRLVARFVIRLLIWLLCARLVSECHSYALQAFLVLSLVLTIWFSVSVSDEQDNQGGRAAPVPANNDGIKRGCETDKGALGFPGPNLRQPTVAPSASSCATQEMLTCAERDDGAATASMKPPFTGVLTPSQHVALMKELGEMLTIGATRCAMDAAFRRKLAKTEMDEVETCICGSGDRFGRCCAPVRDLLLRVVDEA
ncbi:hypothetical protein JKF63_04542 [Porcisia hertigi]|uniref:Uncharacterized protein n=1 Tax=Porcisia hertigi TaxID=2761500 RepID=A0A836L8S7_9TRYP|nr:hypothetical protein JKF63_04542 [Porcisia hertigi]